ncbi:peptidylprolyl isomerase [Sphaerisporangium sp. B11E5]|uniref:peptidylprolyl isomerase n=1 Tax=Sphaerisporangium sp. B11E5 TaxID=3153563 RepID=UPI00325C476E
MTDRLTAPTADTSDMAGMGDAVEVGEHVAAWVGGRVVTVAEVDAREAALRGGPMAARLPSPRSPEGRNLRRWVAQVLVTEELIAQEAAALGLTAPAAPPAPLTLPDALRAGGVVAAVAASSSLARAVREAVTAGTMVPEEEVRGYYDRNPDRFTHPETRHVSRPDGTSLGPVRRGEMAGPLEDAVFTAAEGDVVGPLDGPGGPWTLRVDRVDPGGTRPYEDVRDTIAAELTEAATVRAFTTLLDHRYAGQVRLHRGFEHPADPRHPDATHRH